MKSNHFLNSTYLTARATVCAALFLVLIATSAFGEDTVESVCGDTLNPGPSAAASPEPQKLNYCKAAKTTQDAADTQSILWKVWAGVAGTCATECALSMTGTYTEELLCIVPLAAASLYDGYKSDNFMGALTGLAPQVMNGGTLVDRAKNAMSDEKKQTNIDPKRKDFSSCMSAATSGFQAYGKHKSMKQQEEATASSLASAKALKSETGAPTVSNGFTNTTGELGHGIAPAGTANNTAAGVGAGASIANGGAASTSSSDSCSDKKSGGGLSSAFVSCVVATDKNLPSWVGSPKFQKNIEKSTGKPMAEFLNNSSLTPAEVLASTMGGLGAAGSKLAAAMVADAEGYYGGGAMEGTMYAGGHGGGSSEAAAAAAAAAKDENPFAGLLSGILGGGAAAKGKGNGIREVVFAMQAAKDAKRSLASLAEDPRLGLFSRVTVRYQYVSKRLEGGGP